MNNPEKLAALGTQSKKGRQKTKAKNTTQYMLGPTMRKETQIT
jgi:hypothetical protein